MSNGDDLAAKDAKFGEKMIEIKVRFWTNDIAEEDNKIVPKHAWSSGVVRIKRNKTHNIVPKRPIPFNSLMQIPKAIETALIENKIVLKPARLMKKYFKS